jgi:N-acetylglucosaminyldiphosphoundecaprenol N-acetyl-beta-D-mannosaminyltransferase
MIAAANRHARGRGSVLGCPLDCLTLDDTVDVIDDAIANRRPLQHSALNAAKLVRIQSDETLRAAVAGSELVTADGQAIVWAGRLLGQVVPERVAGIDLFDALLSRAVLRGYGVYLLGSRPDVVERAAAEIRARHPGIRLVGYRHGYFGRSEDEAVVEEIRDTRPDMLFVALETPVKETFLARYRDRIGAPFVMGIGGALDILAGERRRAPRLLQQLGLEWCYRLAQDPRRLARRYLVGNTVFILLVLRALLARWFAGPPRRRMTW